jgi:hypothetical protein
MAGYRIYYCDDQGKVFSAHDFEATNDLDAVERASRLASGRKLPFEVWQDDRLVHRDPLALPAGGAKPPSLGLYPLTDK